MAHLLSSLRHLRSEMNSECSGRTSRLFGLMMNSPMSEKMEITLVAAGLWCKMTSDQLGLLVQAGGRGIVDARPVPDWLSPLRPHPQDEPLSPVEVIDWSNYAYIYGPS